MYEWSEDERAVQAAIRQFVDAEIRPRREELEFGELPPYDILRLLWKSFGIDVLAAESVAKLLADEPVAAPDGGSGSGSSTRGGLGMQGGMGVLLIKEICRVSPGFVGAFGVSLGLCAATILARGTLAQKRRWMPALATLEAIGAWALTEPDSGSDAFGSMRTVARPDGQDYVLDGQKTFITNGPYADTVVVYAKLDDGVTAPRDREILTFVLDTGMPGFTQGTPLRKMGFHSSPTGELFFDAVRVGRDRLLGDPSTLSPGEVPAAEKQDGRDSAKSGFVAERTGVAAMSLGIIEECLEQSTRYAKQRIQFGHPIADYQLIQLKLAQMEIARINVQNMVFRTLDMAKDGKQVSLAEASAMKLYSSQAATEVAMEAIQLFGGNGYMAEYPVEQLARDAKSLMIYAGSNEIQALHVAKGVLGR